MIPQPFAPPVGSELSPFNMPGNSGTKPPETTPNQVVPPPNPMPDKPSGTPAGNQPTAQATSRSKDARVLLTTFQAPGLPVTPPDSASVPAIRPGQDVTPLPNGNTGVPAVNTRQDPTKPVLPGDRLQGATPNLDPTGSGNNSNTVAGPRPELAGGTELLQFLNPVIVLDEAQAAGFPVNSRPYVIGPAETLQYALVNNRSYQYNLEQVFINSLALTLTRFGFQPNFYAGFSPTTSPTGVGIPSNPSDSFNYRTKEAQGGQQSALNIGSAVGVGKLLSFGGTIAAGFANQTVFNFLSEQARASLSVSSSLPLVFSQRFLRGGGRAVGLEPLTQAERNLLYPDSDLRSISSIVCSGHPDQPAAGDWQPRSVGRPDSRLSPDAQLLPER